MPSPSVLRVLWLIAAYWTSSPALAMLVGRRLARVRQNYPLPSHG